MFLGFTGRFRNALSWKQRRLAHTDASRSLMFMQCFARQLAPLSAAVLLAGAATQSSDVQISFDAPDRSGEVVVAVFDSQAAWRARSDPIRTARIPPNETMRLADLPRGRYGVMAFQDKNGNGRLDTLPIGLPTEPYGFSRNARGVFGPPAWSAAAVEVGSTPVRQVIVLR